MPIAFNRPIFLVLWLLVPVLWFMMGRSFLKHRSGPQKLFIGGLRSLALVILGLSLSDPKIPSHGDRVNVFFCLDVSESIGSEEKQAAHTFMSRTMKGMDKEDRAGLIVFGKDPLLEVPLGEAFEPSGIRSTLNTHLTGIYDALQFAIGKFPQEGEKRIVLFTDGNENLKHSLDMANLAAAFGIKIFPVPLASWFGKSEVFVKGLETPPAVSLETPFEIRIVVISSARTQGHLILFRDDKLLADRPVTVEPGKNAFVFADRIVEPGLYPYKAVINFPQDVFFQNNEGVSFTRATKRSQVLYLAGEGAHQTPLAQSLTAQGLDLVFIPADRFAGSVHELMEHDAVILDNVSGQALSDATMENIETYVRDFGGGLIMIGGDRSFGAGYHKTPVEKALPVFMDAPTDVQFSRLCLIFVLDKSSSMSGNHAGKSKLEMAKIAAFSSIQMLNPADQVGIVAFDSEFRWIVPITPAKERQEIADRLSRVKEDGGTLLYPALEDAFRKLQQSKASRKHVIVLSDGETDPADFKSLVQSMSGSGISVSTVCIGANSDLKLMESIARWGGGRSYFTDDPGTIPNIFVGETQIVARDILVEKILQPEKTLPNEMMLGIDDEPLPAISGQVLTYPKPGVGIWIQTDEGPLLAAWRYGLGRSVAFTSDLSTRWCRDWLRWDHFGRFTSQMVKWAQRKETRERTTAIIERTGQTGRFTVDAADMENRFLNNLNLRVKILFPSERSQTLSLNQTAPGRYQGVFPAEEIGRYFFTLFGEEDASNPSAEATRPQVFGFGIPYTDEFNRVGVDRPLLEQLAAVTKGGVLPLEQPPADLFRAASDSKNDETPLWPLLTLLFLLLLMLDVAARKLLDFGWS